MKRLNRLKDEISPYLLQHAANPVAWHPWNEQAFIEARELDRAVFVSIGYSTCHWCHVMARECFEDEEVARAMNAAFICIKVDREELPHIDAVYMSVCQMMTGSAGWPLTVIMTPDKQPFFAATYLPKHSRQGIIGMMELIPVIEKAWKTNREDLVHSAHLISLAVKDALREKPGDFPDRELIHLAFEELSGRFSPTYGGFGEAPKFPCPHNIMFLLRYHRRTGDSRALNMATKTLDAMRMGGIYDHIGFGFHRYATDARWLVPHFEKMLYDQALAAITYTEAYLATGRKRYRKTAEEVLTYVLRDMASQDGTFFSAQDADTEGSEGAYYRWTDRELRSILNRDDHLLAVSAFSLQNRPEAREAQNTGEGVLHMTQSPKRTAEHLGMDEAAFYARLEQIRMVLFEKRSERTRPFKDELVLTDWNGLMIAALAKAGKAFGSRAYTDAAARAADFILRNMTDMEGYLFHLHRAGRTSGEATASDYAFFIWGLLELYGAGFDMRYLDSAAQLTRRCIERCWDSTEGGLFLASEGSSAVIARIKESYDQALPSSNSVFLLDLIWLSRITGDADLELKARQTLQAFSQTFSRAPSSHAFMMLGLDLLLGPIVEVVLSGGMDSTDMQEKLAALRSRFLPHVIVMHRPEKTAGELPEHLRDKVPHGSRTTAYVCSNRACLAPTTDTREMIELVMNTL
ncbi:MAG TPA: thioredoxin domain-containing protein [Deltaproteobacteria bacterium]|nr:thioredoxin domain-containing protein [Deltaproteobacteria bacterium]